MRVAVLSDTRLPTASGFAGHGLGKAVLTIARGLARRGHEVTLFAGPGSDAGANEAGPTVAFRLPRLVIERREEDFMRHLEGERQRAFDVVLDNTHHHTLQRFGLSVPVVNVSHDREAAPGHRAVFPSAAHRDWHGYDADSAVVIPNGVDVVPAVSGPARSRYFAYMSTFASLKGPVMAREAARIAGVRLVMAGPTPPAPPSGVEYIGPLAGVDKFEFLAGAAALLFPAGTEAGPLVPLEAQACACPVIVSAFGGAPESIVVGVTGFLARDTNEMAEAIARVCELDRSACRAWVASRRNTAGMLDTYERVLARAAAGDAW